MMETRNTSKGPETVNSNRLAAHLPGIIGTATLVASLVMLVSSPTMDTGIWVLVLNMASQAFISAHLRANRADPVIRAMLEATREPWARWGGAAFIVVVGCALGGVTAASGGTFWAGLVAYAPMVLFQDLFRQVVVAGLEE